MKRLQHYHWSMEYTAERVEYTGNENDVVTKTPLCIMIKNLCGKYMVALYPL